MATHPSIITSLPRSPDDDRHSRMTKYFVTMCIRLVCIALCLVVQGWWLVVCVAGAVILPYVAVVLANAVDSKTSTVERPGILARLRQNTDDDTTSQKQS